MFPSGNIIPLTASLVVKRVPHVSQRECLGDRQVEERGREMGRRWVRSPGRHVLSLPYLLCKLLLFTCIRGVAKPMTEHRFTITTCHPLLTFYSLRRCSLDSNQSLSTRLRHNSSRHLHLLPSLYHNTLQQRAGHMTSFLDLKA